MLAGKFSRFSWRRAAVVAAAFAMVPSITQVALEATPVEAAGVILFEEDFESFAQGSDPAEFVDTAAGNSMAPDDALFAVSSVANGNAFTTASSASNIHSHVVAPAAQAFSSEPGYVFTGAMRVDSATSGIGVTFFSDYPNSDSYYRLRRFGNGGSFRLSPHATSITSGTTDSGVVPTAGSWYRFEIEVADTGSATTIRAKVWADGAPVPADWQIDAVDSSATRRTSGTIGVWSYLAGVRHWDDFTVAAFGTPDPHAVTVATVGSGTVATSPDLAVHPHGSTVQLTATPDAGWDFIGWNGDLTGSQNPADVVVTADMDITAIFAEPSDALIDQDFEAEAPGSDPADWIDTSANNSMVEDDAIFDVAAVGGTQALSTASTASNIHSHYVGTGAASAANYEYSGRLRMTDAAAGIGVTVLSDYPNSDTYYRIRRYGNGGAFHLSPHGATMTGGTTTSSVVPAPNTWYRFRIQVLDTGVQTEVRARVWPDGTAEPANWQIDAVDASPDRLTAGTVGLWSWGNGSKAWDDLVVGAPAPAPRYTISTSTTGSGTVEASPSAADYAAGETVTLTATPASGWQFSAWSGAVSGTANPTTTTVTGDQSVTATFIPIPTYTVGSNVVGNGAVSVAPAQASYPAGSTVSISAVPAPGWTFNGWSGALAGSANPASLTVDADLVVTATFVQTSTSTVTLTVDTVGQGTATADPDQATYQSGTEVTVTAVPEAGWAFTRWDTDPVVADDWWNSQWSYRLPVDVAAAGTDRSDALAEIDVDFIAAWSSLGVSGTFDPDSIRVVEVDDAGGTIDGAVPFQFDEASGYDADNAAIGTLSILLGGSTPADATRHFHVYFDDASKGFAPAVVAPRVTLTDGVVDEGFDAVRVETSSGTYYYTKDGGGFSSIVDEDGNDWVTHNSTFGSAGTYRGIPNLVFPDGFMRPDGLSTTTTIVDAGPLKATLRSEAAGGAWVTEWEIGPASAKMTVLAANGDYWFLYEGTPGGSLDLASDVVVRSDGTQTTAGQAWTGDIAGEEWAYFGDPGVGASGRSLYLVNHTEDSAVDSYYPMEGNMTVFGFGRSGISPLLDAAPATFTIGLTDGVAYPSVASHIRSEFRDLTALVGSAESAAGSATSPTLTFDIVVDQTVTAVFDEIQPVTLDLTTTGSGSVAATPDQATYQPGDVVTVTATPAAGSYFSGWSGDRTGSANPLTVTLTADTDITANFAQDGVLTIDTNVTGDGTIQFSPSQSTYDFGQQVTVTAVPGSGSVFTTWGGDLTGTANPQTITIDGNNSITASFGPSNPDAPVIDIWYGDTQEFGQNGRPQPWQNVLGNVSDPDGITSLTYRLNGGPVTNLSIGPDTRRLFAPGDFNIDLDDQDLVDGPNSVVITAIDGTNSQTTRTVTVDYESGNIWPSNYTIDWSAASNIHEVAQPIDGEWVIEADGVRSITPAYDRLIGIGDVAWTDYEVEFPVTINSIDNSGFGSGTSGRGAGLGVLMRWNGHTDVPVVFPQPKTGYLPYGAIGWYWWTNPGSARLRIDGNNQVVISQSPNATPPTTGVEYIMKMRVTTQPGVGGLYQLKSWPSSQPEPAGWQLSGQESMSDPQSGSIMLLAHHVDATFGDVQITPLGQTTGTITTQTVGNGTVVVDPVKTEYDLGEQVTVTAVPDPNWDFAGWQGDLSGTANPQTFAVTGDMDLTATFIDPAAPPIIGNVSVQRFTTSAIISWTTDKLASSSVSYGLDAFHGSTVSDPALTTSHSVSLPGLDPATTYHFSVTSAANGGSASTPDDTFVTLDANNPSGLTSDDFNVCSIDTGGAGLWTLVDPIGDGDVSVDGTTLALSVPAGVAHDVWEGGNNSVRLMQDVNDADFEFEVKFDSPVATGYQLQGLLVEQDASNYLRFDFYGNQGVTYLFAAEFVNGTPTVVANMAVTVGSSSYMRVARSGDNWVQQWSADGSTWSAGASFSRALSVDSVGVFAGNAGGAAPAHTALVDYVFNTTSPVVPEDGTNQNCGGGGGGDTTAPVITGVQSTPGTTSAVISWTTDEPSSSAVAFGPTAAYGSVESSAALVTAHSVVVSGLTPSTTYHFSVSSADGSGNSASTSDATFTTFAPSSNLVESDDFNACAVDSGRWTLVDPIGDGSASVDGTSLLLSVPGGVAHDVWTTGNNAVRLMQQVNDVDFGFEAKFDSVVGSTFQMQGVLVGSSPGNLLRFDFYSSAGQTYLFAARFVNGNATVLANVPVNVGAGSSYLRVTRAGDVWTQEWSTDGASWTTNASFTHALAVTEVGVFAGNAGSNAPAHTAVIDYVFNTATPISPEDPTNVNCN